MEPVTNILQPYTGKTLHGYSGKQLDIAGQAAVQVICKQQVTDLPFGYHSWAMASTVWAKLVGGHQTKLD